jgi:AcrR family transcriptional regulator
MRRCFQRARKPEEKELRRQAILKAARRLMSEVGSSDLSMLELARRSGVSKPNIYRYFESREEVLLQVWIEEVRALKEGLATAFATVPVGDVAATAAAITGAFAAQPRLCELTSIATSLIERNLSVEAFTAAKRTLHELGLPIAALLHERLPSIAMADCAWVASAVGVFVAGLWPAANPGPVAGEVMAQPEFAARRPDFRRDLTRFLELMFAGLTGDPVAAR